MVEAIEARLPDEGFDIQESAGISSKWVMKPNALGATLHWLLNDPELMRALGDIGGCDDVGFFSGRLYRLDPGSGQAFGWHDDREHDKQRRLAISVNLGTTSYSGGVLRIREKRARESVSEIPNVGPGDAVLFRVADHVEHAVTPVAGTVAKVAFNGWFRAGESYYASLMHQLTAQRA